jgi:hypothetical protein
MVDRETCLANQLFLYLEDFMNVAALSAALLICVSPVLAQDAKPFEQTLRLQGVIFKVKATNQGSLNHLSIVSEGLRGNPAPIEREIDGAVTGAEIADLDANGSPEFYIYVTSAGSGSYGSVVAYAANKKESLSEIHMPDLAEDKVNSKGYMGHDQFAVVENTLARRFPVYRPGDTNGNPTGGMRQLEYKLVPGEAGWGLRLKKSTEFK